MQASNDAMDQTSSLEPLPTKSNKLCHHWYHRGQCYRDPANPTKPGKLCPYDHHLPSGNGPKPELSTVPAWVHKGPCGLELCPWKDREWEKDSPTAKDGGVAAAAEDTSSPDAAKTGKRKRNDFDEDADEKTATPKRTKTPKEAPAHPSPAALRTPNTRTRKRRPRRHPDDPRDTANGRSIISYAEEAEDAQLHEPAMTSPAPAPSSSSNTTCFFWYHGNCKRSREMAGCGLLHALTSPPTMVQPPPGYVHARACGLEWCPGDAREGASAGASRKRRSNRRPVRGGEVWAGKERQRGNRVDLSAAQGLEDDGRQEEDRGSQAGSEAASCGQPEQGNGWFLAGFPQG
ncbi:hypothetical protein LTR08_003707 [Meristemomyces frigidus]|nr:hypothetical protein LTR08_003707 [Meristemomyces frigidus]